MVTISGVKKDIKISFFKSLRFRITFLIIGAGLIPGLIMRGVILNRYEDRAVELRTAEIQNQCAILCDQLSSTGYSGGVASEIIQTELTQLTNIYNGRVMIINDAYQIIEDTYDMDVGKTIVSGDVIRCFQRESTSHYDDRNRYIEVTSPILDSASEKVVGVLLMSVSTDVIADQQTALAGQTWVAWAAAALIVVILAVLAGILMVRPFKRITRSIEAVTEGYEDQYLHAVSYTHLDVYKRQHVYHAGLSYHRCGNLKGNAAESFKRRHSGHLQYDLCGRGHFHQRYSAASGKWPGGEPGDPIRNGRV